MLLMRKTSLSVLGLPLWPRQLLSFDAKRGLSTIPAARLDYRYIKENRDAIIKNCKRRRLNVEPSVVDEVIAAYEESVNLTKSINRLLAHRNALSKQIKEADDGEKPTLLSEAAALKPRLQEIELERSTVDSRLLSLAVVLPNSTHPAVPVGDESKVKIIDYINEENQYQSDKPEDHMEIAERLKLVNLEVASRASGMGFYYLQNEAVLLELALTQFALSRAVASGYEMFRCPDLVRSDLVSACGFRPRDEKGQQVYEVPESGLSLVGTAEIPLAALGLEHVFQESELPKRCIAVGRAFRAEAGARGAENRGLYRVHEFTKIELFTFCKPDQAAEEFDRIIQLQTSMVKELGLCARLLEMPTEELGASAHRKFDIEAWIPSRGTGGEITSASDCTDYQARRLHARYKDTSTGKLHFVNTLNGTAIAIPRFLTAALETWYSHGRIKVPSCLQHYMGGITEIGTRVP